MAMDNFSFKKFASDASAVFNRAVQFTEEKLGKAEKTELDAHFENLLNRADKTEEHTKHLLSCMEGYLQPNPIERMEEFFYEKSELRKNEAKLNNLESLGQAMTDASNEFGPGTPYGSALQKVSATQYKIGSAEREFVTQAVTNSLTPIKRFLEGDMKTIAKERKMLMNKRLDLDACKSRLRKARSLESQANAEADLRVAQSEFDKQAEILKLLLEGIQTAHNNHLKCLKDFVEAQMCFYAQAHQHMADLQRELSGSWANTTATPKTSLVHNDITSGSATGSPDFVGGKSGGGMTVTGLDAADMGTKRAKVLFNYDSVTPQEISVVKDEVLIIYRLPGLDPDFVMAEKGSLRGRLPLSYLEIMN